MLTKITTLEEVKEVLTIVLVAQLRKSLEYSVPEGTEAEDTSLPKILAKGLIQCFDRLTNTSQQRYLTIWSRYSEEILLKLQTGDDSLTEEELRSAYEGDDWDFHMQASKYLAKDFEEIVMTGLFSND